MTEDSIDLSGVFAVVVHYRNYESVANTVNDLLNQGVSPENVMLVDNSEQPERRAELESGLPPLIAIRYSTNGGYAAAINFAIAQVSLSREVRPEFLIVATHETRMRDAAVGRLISALASDPRAAVAGPTLISGELEPFVWSTGGYLSRFGHYPRHTNHRDSFDERDYLGKKAVERAWLDGAFLAYRWGDIEEHPISEDFFLYMEETDLHLRLRAAEKLVLWVPDAIVWQSSGGVPAYYLARNLRLLFQRHEPGWRQLAVPLEIARRLASDALKRRDLSSIRPSLRGYFAKLPSKSIPAAVRVFVVNPLGGALKHYVAQLADVIGATGSLPSTFETSEPSVSGKSRIRWVLDYIGLLREAAKAAKNSDGQALVLVVWPVLGYLDLVLLGALRVPATLVIHDPIPLVRALGYDSRSRKLASTLARGRSVIAQSEQAAAVIRAEMPGLVVDTLPLPIFTPVSAPISGSDRATVQVLGQYKPDRDLAALEQIATLGSAHTDYRIDGRGWPNVTGWTVRSKFVPEAELDELIARSSVVVVPYRRFFQSAIAIRALESGVPVVGPADSSLAEVLGDGSPLLASADSGGWILAVEAALSSGQELAALSANAWRLRAVKTWSEWVSNASNR